MRDRKRWGSFYRIKRSSFPIDIQIKFYGSNKSSKVRYKSSFVFRERAGMIDRTLNHGSKVSKNGRAAERSTSSSFLGSATKIGSPSHSPRPRIATPFSAEPRRWPSYFG